MKEFSIMTFNLMNDHLYPFGKNSFPKRAIAIQKLISEFHPDLIGVQELTKSMFPYLQEIFQEYSFFGDSRHSLINDEYTSILYRKDRFSLIGGETFWLSHTAQKPGSKVSKAMYPRIVTIGYLKDIETQDFFTFANTHLDISSKDVRNEQADILAQLLIEEEKGSFTCVTGDFNTTSDSDALHLFQKCHLKDAVKDSVGSSLRGMIGSHRNNNKPIDHIYVSSGLSVMNVHKITKSYDGVYPSDHYPILAYIAI